MQYQQELHSYSALHSQEFDCPFPKTKNGLKVKKFYDFKMIENTKRLKD